MKTTAAISPMMANVLTIAKIQPMAEKPAQMAMIAPTVFKITRPTLLRIPRRPGATRRRSVTGDAAEPLPDETGVAAVPHVPLDPVPMSVWV
jgi:hypothetical protein